MNKTTNITEMTFLLPDNSRCRILGAQADAANPGEAECLVEDLDHGGTWYFWLSQLSPA